MKIYIIGLIVMISPFFSYSHNPLSSRYHLEAGENVSLLTINLSQDGVNQALLKQYDRAEIEKMNQVQMEEWIVKYIKDNFELYINGEPIKISKGGIKYGSHQTDLRFVLPPIPRVVNAMDISIQAFKENEDHQTIFSYVFNGKKGHVILTRDNYYSKTVELSAMKKDAGNYWYYLTGVVVLAFVMWLYRRKKQDLA